MVSHEMRAGVVAGAIVGVYATARSSAADGMGREAGGGRPLLVEPIEALSCVMSRKMLTGSRRERSEPRRVLRPRRA